MRSQHEGGHDVMGVRPRHSGTSPALLSLRHCAVGLGISLWSSSSEPKAVFPRGKRGRWAGPGLQSLHLMACAPRPNSHLSKHPFPHLQKGSEHELLWAAAAIQWAALRDMTRPAWSSAHGACQKGARAPSDRSGAVSCHFALGSFLPSALQNGLNQVSLGSTSEELLWGRILLLLGHLLLLRPNPAAAPRKPPACFLRLPCPSGFLPLLPFPGESPKPELLRPQPRRRTEVGAS